MGKHRTWGKSRLVYSLVDPRDKLVRYVGATIRGTARPREHLRSPRPTLRDWVLTLGEFNPDHCFDILEFVEDGIDLFEREKFWILKLKEEGHPILNITEPKRSRGRQHQKKPRQKIINLAKQLRKAKEEYESF